LARGVERLKAARRSDLRLDGGDSGIADADIAFARRFWLGSTTYRRGRSVVGVSRSERLSSRLCLLNKSSRRDGSTSALQE